MPQTIYINSSAQNPAEAFVISELSPQPVEFYRLVLSDNDPLNLYVVDGSGNFDAISGAGGYSIEMLIGRIGQPAVAAQSSWSGITNGWTASIDLDTLELSALFAGADEIEAYVQITITDPDGKPRTYGQQKIRIENRVLPAGGAGPTPIDDYLTSAETFDKFVQNRSAVTALTGGGPLSLDGITTLNKGPGWLIAVVLADAANLYKLTAGTDAESSPAVIRPDDYAAGTNEKVWKLVLSGQYIHTQLAPANPWIAVHGRTVRPGGIRIMTTPDYREIVNVPTDDSVAGQTTITFGYNVAGIAIFVFS